VFEKKPRHIVLEDDYGLLSARMLVDRIVELVRIIKAGEEALQKKNDGTIKCMLECSLKLRGISAMFV